MKKIKLFSIAITSIFAFFFTACEEDVVPVPVAFFSVSETYITEGNNITFTDQSINAPTSWAWNFGDGGFSTEQNPTYTYTTVGTYTVSLTATNIAGSHTCTKIDSILVNKQSITGQSGTLTDVDGNNYIWVGIGAQAWMAENLKTTKYADGTNIPTVIDGNNSGDSSDEWAALENNNTDKAYCWYDDDIANKDLYGAYYTYAAATNGDNSGTNVQGACPDGWHLPSKAEWSDLKTYLSYNGYDVTEGYALKTINGWDINGNGIDVLVFLVCQVATDTIACLVRFPVRANKVAGGAVQRLKVTQMLPTI